MSFLALESRVVTVALAPLLVAVVTFEQTGVVIGLVVLVLSRVECRNLALIGVRPWFLLRVHKLPMTLLLSRCEVLVFVRRVSLGLDVGTLVHFRLTREARLTSIGSSSLPSLAFVSSTVAVPTAATPIAASAPNGRDITGGPGRCPGRLNASKFDEVILNRIEVGKVVRSSVKAGLRCVKVSSARDSACASPSQVSFGL